MQRLLIAGGVLLALALVSFLVFWFGFVTNVDAHEMAFTFNRFGGDIEVVEEQGWVVRNPIRYAVHTVDMRPFQIRITTVLEVDERVLNAKLVQFNPDGLQEFVDWHGRNAGESRARFREIMKTYAFAPDGGASCPFITVKQDTGSIEEGPLGQAAVSPAPQAEIEAIPVEE